MSLLRMLQRIVNSKRVLAIECFLTNITRINKLSWEMYGLNMVLHFRWFFGLKLLAQSAIVVPLVRVVAGILGQIFAV